MGGGCKTYHESWFRGAGNGCVITTTGSECHFGGLGGLFVCLFGGGDVIGIGIGMCFVLSLSLNSSCGMVVVMS